MALNDTFLAEQATEVWKDIPSLDGVYQASSLGRVRSMDRTVIRESDGAILKRRGKLLPGAIKSTGYIGGTLCYPEKSLLFHRLVAEAFLANPNNLPQVNHKNGIKTDNKVTNLEWVSVQKNCLHSTRVLGKKRLEDHNLAKLKESDIDDLKLLRFYGASYAEIGRAYGVHEDTIAHAVKGVTWVKKSYNE